MEFHMKDIIYAALPIYVHKQKRRHFHAKTTRANLDMYIGVGARAYTTFSCDCFFILSIRHLYLKSINKRFENLTFIGLTGVSRVNTIWGNHLYIYNGVFVLVNISLSFLSLAHRRGGLWLLLSETRRGDFLAGSLAAKVSELAKMFICLLIGREGDNLISSFAIKVSEPAKTESKIFV